MEPVQFQQVLEQKMYLSPRQLQSMKMLQMDSLALTEYVSSVMQENPAFDREEGPSEGFRSLCREVSWMNASARPRSAVEGEAAENEGPATADSGLDSLSAMLTEQLSRRNLSRKLEALCQYLIGMLTPEGYLEQEDLDSVCRLGVPEELVQKAVDLLQSLEPAGVAASGLGECLALQLRRMPDAPPLALTLVERFLPQLGKRQYSLIARKLRTTEQAVQKALDCIRTLDPRPGELFEKEESTAEYICPDVFIIQREGELQVVLNEVYEPRVSVSGYYQKMMEQAEDRETRDYLKRKLRQAAWVVEALARRRDTLERCARSIVRLQSGFFEGETLALSPMTLGDVAGLMQVHPSTVCRCVKGKYLQCRQGTYPLRYFFSRRVGEEDTSAQGLRVALAELIRTEDPAHPLSDRVLAERLSEAGTPVARRTVAKYRGLLHIPPASGRKRR